MTDRDHFAAAALTGLIANGDYSVESTPTLAWRMADAMLRERDKTSAQTNNDRGSATLTDAEREAINWAAEIACADDRDDFALWNAGIMQRLLERLGGER